jgi:hypothetical protein
VRSVEGSSPLARMLFANGTTISCERAVERALRLGQEWDSSSTVRGAGAEIGPRMGQQQPNRRLGL